MARKFQQGKFIPKNPEKYVGDPTSIFWRSSWEKKAMLFFDSQPNILKWNSEELVVPYINPLDEKQHRYFTDFVVQYKTRAGEIKTMIVEIKPFYETQKPQNKGNRKRFLEETATYIKNQAKWAAAREFAQRNGSEFVILTEKELGIK